MSLVGTVTVLIFFFCLVSATVTGRRQWLVGWIWCVPALCASFLTPRGSDSNGLVLLICLLMFFQVVYSLWGVKLWCTQTRKKSMILSFVIYVVNFLLLAYCFYQSMLLTKFYESAHNSKLISVFLSGALASIAAWAMQNVSVSAIELYFSKKEKFPLIDCAPVSSRGGRRNETQRKYAVKGVQNGITYIFNMTQKAYLLLKPQKSFVFSVKRGIFGGVYVIGNVYQNDSKRRLKRVNRLLIKKALFVVLAAVLLILLLIRIRTGAGFEDIFAVMRRGVRIGIE